MSLNSALKPLLMYLPKTLESEERRLLALEDQDEEVETAVNGNRGSSSDEKHGEKNGIETKHLTSHHTAVSNSSKPRKKPTLISKFMRPDLHTDYHTLRRLVPREFATIEYDDITQNDAYHHPSVKSQPPLLWIPRDPMGVSTQEVRETSNVIPITDEGASLDEKNNIVWDRDNAQTAPIYQEPVYY